MNSPDTVAPATVKLVTAYAVLQSFDELWALCECCQTDWPQECMVIAERALGSCIEPWSNFKREVWTRGRCFGPDWEIQWRSYGALVRAALILEVTGEEDVASRQTQWRAMGWQGIKEAKMLKTVETMSLQTTEYQEATLCSYGDEDAPAQFVRYSRVGKTQSQ